MYNNTMITEEQNKQIQERLTRGQIKDTSKDIQNFLGSKFDNHILIARGFLKDEEVKRDV